MTNKEVAESLRRAKQAAINEDLDDMVKYLSEAIKTLERSIENR